MAYEIVQPPFTLQFRDMSKSELKEYFKWFQNISSQRLDELVNTVHETLGYEGWRPDFTPASLDVLGEWFATNVERRPRTSEEIQDIQSKSSISIEVSGQELTNRTFSLAIDVAIYLSQVFLKNNSNLRWDQRFKSKRDANFGQPVIVGFGPVPFNPVHMMVTLAYGISNNIRSGKSLREIYDIWRKMIRY